MHGRHSRETFSQDYGLAWLVEYASAGLLAQRAGWVRKICDCMDHRWTVRCERQTCCKVRTLHFLGIWNQCLMQWPSFFFRRGTGDRSIINHLVPTLAYQLAHSVPATKPLIQKVLQSDPTIDQKPLNYQLKELMIKPMLAVTNTTLVSLKLRNHMIIVVDALDECDDKDLTAQFIETIIDACQGGGRFPFRIFFTSRVEEHIRDKFESPRAKKAIHCLDLLDFDAHVDIRTFFQDRLMHIHATNRTMRSVPEPWPSDKDLNVLVEKANGSFIFASTLIKCFEDDEFPPQILQRVLKVDIGLDSLYTQVLSAAPRNDNFDRVVGTVILLTRPLSVTALGRLLQLENYMMLRVLLGIQSIVMIPADDHQPIQLFHTSFRDFMTAKLRSDNYFVDPPAHNLSIATDCLKVMQADSDNLFFEEEAQEYACLNWFRHLSNVLTQGGIHFLDPSSSDYLLTHLTAFMGQSFDRWTNTLISLDKMEGTLEDMWKLVSKLHVGVCSSAATVHKRLITCCNISSWLQGLRILYSLLKVSQHMQRFDLYTSQHCQVLIQHHCNLFPVGACLYISCQFEE